MFTEIRRGVLFTAVTIVLIGGAYNGLLWAIGRVAFPTQSEGSLIRRSDGTIV
jgi:K+-transporting ATPase c subunit